jgi:hypothetical protein
MQGTWPAFSRPRFGSGGLVSRPRRRLALHRVVRDRRSEGVLELAHEGGAKTVLLLEELGLELEVLLREAGLGVLKDALELGFLTTTIGCSMRLPEGTAWPTSVKPEEDHVTVFLLW